MPKIYGVVKAFKANSLGALVLVIPKELQQELKVEGNALPSCNYNIAYASSSITLYY
jgi:hypothetical protein